MSDSNYKSGIVGILFVMIDGDGSEDLHLC